MAVSAHLGADETRAAYTNLSNDMAGSVHVSWENMQKLFSSDWLMQGILGRSCLGC